MKRYLRALALLLCLLTVFLPLTSCGGQDGREVISVTIPPMAEFVRAVAGEDFRIVTLVPPGYSPESYEPTVRTMTDFASSRVFFSMGLPVDEATLIPALTEGTSHVSLSERVAALYPDREIDGGRDPHIWLSPDRAAVMVNAIASELAAMYPDRWMTYVENAEAYLSRLSAADAAVREAIATSGVTELIVYHPAFGYFADEYGLTMHALEEHGGEATATRMAEMVDLAKERGIRVIFYQAETDGRQARAFAHEIGGTAVKLSPLAEDYAENLERMAEAIASAKGD